MSDTQALEELIKEARSLRYRLTDLSETAHVQGERFIELGKALVAGSRLRDEFPFEYCDVAQARQLLAEIPELLSRLENLELRIKRRFSTL